MKLLDRFETATNIKQGTGNSRPRSATQMLALILSLALIFATSPESLLAFQDTQSNAPAADQNGQDSDQNTQASVPSGDQAPVRTAQSPEQLQQLVAPIALYPDSLVAQILAA